MTGAQVATPMSPPLIADSRNAGPSVDECLHVARENKFASYGFSDHDSRSPGTTVRALADRAQPMQAFQNLIGNAIKFHAPDQRVMEIDAQRRHHEWGLTVSGNGIGISEENGNDVFVIFRRRHRRSEYPGSGIGLSICKKIVKGGGGKIRIEAQPKAGSCFRFSLPAEPRGHAQEPSTPSGAEPGS
jgi:light-regulated signal transduction histidine kinase (bacteriophytochrome)